MTPNQSESEPVPAAETPRGFGNFRRLSAALFVLGAAIWVGLVRANLGNGYWYCDDSIFLNIPPFSPRDLISLVLTPTDSNGYYRPIGQILFAFAGLFLPERFAAYQWITIALIFFGAAMTMIAARYLLRSSPFAALAGLLYLYSPTHLKTLAWTTLWFQSAAAGFAVAALACRIAFHETSSRRARHLSLIFWLLAIASNNGIHAFAVTLLSVDLVLAQGPLLRRLKSAIDLLVLDAVLFSWIYLFHSPFRQAQFSTNQFFDLKETTLAFFDYLESSVVHFTGDTRTVGPHLIETALGAGTFALALLAGFRWKRLLIIPAAMLGSTLVIALIFHRWNLEYAAPTAFGMAIFLGSQLKLMEAAIAGRSAALAKAFSLMILAGAAVGLPFKFLSEVKPTLDFLVTEQKDTAEFLRHLLEVDRQVPAGVPFLVQMPLNHSRGAPALHYLHQALDSYFGRRLVLLDKNEFASGESQGWLFEDNAIIQEILKRAVPPVVVRCTPDACSFARQEWK